MNLEVTRQLERLAKDRVIKRPVCGGSEIYDTGEEWQNSDGLIVYDCAEPLWLAACVEALDRWAADTKESRSYELLVEADGVYEVRLFYGSPDRYMAKSRLESLVSALEAIHDAS